MTNEPANEPANLPDPGTVGRMSPDQLFTIGEFGPVVELTCYPWLGDDGRWVANVRVVPGRAWSDVLRVDADGLYPLTCDMEQEREASARELAEDVGEWVRAARREKIERIAEDCARRARAEAYKAAFRETVETPEEAKERLARYADGVPKG